MHRTMSSARLSGRSSRKRLLGFITCLGCLALLEPTGAHDLNGDLGSRLESFRADMDSIISASSDEHDWRNRSAALHEVYRRWFPDVSLNRLTASANRSELTQFFYTTFDYLLHAGRKPKEKILERVFRHLVERGWADGNVIEYMHRYFLTFRLFDEARAFRRDYPDQGLPAPPPIVPLASAPSDDPRTVLRFINRDFALERQAIDLRSSPKVLVIGHPSCHFSKSAVSAIAADPQLSKAMSTAAIWLTGPFSSLTDGVIAQWNRQHPAYSYRYVEFKSDWSEVNYWGTPSFYFIKDGQLVKKVVGWPNDSVPERKEALRTGLHAIGALQ